MLPSPKNAPLQNIASALTFCLDFASLFFERPLSFGGRLFCLHTDAQARLKHPVTMWLGLNQKPEGIGGKSRNSHACSVQEQPC
jgi:hypothetical protein